MHGGIGVRTAELLRHTREWGGKEGIALDSCVCLPRFPKTSRKKRRVWWNDCENVGRRWSIFPRGMIKLRYGRSPQHLILLRFYYTAQQRVHMAGGGGGCAGMSSGGSGTLLIVVCRSGFLSSSSCTEYSVALLG